MACRPCVAASVALKEATLLFPNRSRVSDGTCASQKHSTENPNSDHEPDRDGEATAFDLTDDKAGGCDADAFAEMLRLRRDPRVKYVICNRRMFSSYPTSVTPAWEWRPYNGANPHDSHTHVSILYSQKNSTDPWWFAREEDDMPWTDQDSANLQEMVSLLKQMNHNISATAELGGRLAKMAVDLDRIADKIAGAD